MSHPALFPPGAPWNYGCLQATQLTSCVMALSLVGLEVGFPLVYRSGWNIGLAAVLVKVMASLIRVPMAIFFFKGNLSWVNIGGILVCLAGLVMLNWKP
jgi:hypothetical protein